MKIREALLLAALLYCGALGAQNADFTDARLLSFEESAAPFSATSGSKLTRSDAHYKHGAHSARWKWSSEGAQLRIHAPVDYLAQNPNPRETSVSTFVFWVYSPRAIDGTLRIEFRKQGRTCAWFDYKLGFTGWRGAWVAFDRDMQGQPEEDMDETIVTILGAKRGTLFFDHWILSSFQDVRQHTADFQAPYINKETDSHWLVLLRSWNNPLEMEVADAVSPTQQRGLDSVKHRLTRILLEGGKPAKIETLRKQYQAYGIAKNSDGTLRGKPIHFVRYGETYINLGDDYAERTKALQTHGQLLRQCTDLLYKLAVTYNTTTDSASRRELARMYVTLLRHLLDQGFAAGSAQGTLHHLGYSMRNFYTGPVLMLDVLRKAGMDCEVQQAMEWFSGVGEVKLAPQVAGIDIDAFNTSLIGRLSSILMMRDTPEKVAYLRAFSRWADNGCKYTEGTSPCFKSDGTVHHHRRHYPAYAIGGFDGGVRAIWLLHGTDFAISAESHANQKRALLEMRFYCNQASFPLALSGRHPDGKGALIPWHYALLSKAGTPDGTTATDPELAAAYLRLSTAEEPDNRYFTSLGFAPEASPSGNRVYGYNASQSHRRGNWLLTAAGHSRYLWSTEIYQQMNHYGRYLTHGSLQLLGEGEPVNSFGSGFRQEGWDWCHIPGTTATELPMAEMKAEVLNVDTFSGYEEMLLSDETFAGGVSHEGRNGAFGMILHEHDKYNGSLRARKSFFFFDNRVVALGSGIENAKPGCEVHTTLFQNHLEQSSDPILVNGETITEYPYVRTLTGGVLRDNLGTGYFIPRGKVRVTRARQHSLHEETDAPTEGDFAKAWINHGGVIDDGSYEYLQVVKASDAEMTAYAAQRPYRVLAHSRRAHIVRDLPTGVTGYVLFEAGAVGDSLLLDASLPSLVMIGGSDDAKTISVCDPDLRFYEGPSDELYTPDGKRIERSIYSRKWIDNPSIASHLQLTLNGRWALEGTPAGCVAEMHGNTTRLRIECREAATREVKLIRIE